MFNANDLSNAFARSLPDATEGSIHTYRDHADDDEAPHLLHQFIIESTIARSGADHPFPIKLHYMLSKIAEDGLTHVVSWQPHGRCFLVHDQKEFVERVLKCFFRQSKFASFQRQLNLYGFRRLTTGRDRGAYYHEFFLRSRPLLAHRIVRTRVKGTGTRKPSSPETEPNFYLMRHLPNESKQPAMINPAAHLSLQNLLPTALESDPQPPQLQRPPEPQVLPPAHQAQLKVEHSPQLHPLPNQGLRDPNPTPPAPMPQTSTVATVDIGSVEPGLALLAPLMSYLMPPANSPDKSSSLTSNTNALSKYEDIVSKMMQSNGHF